MLLLRMSLFITSTEYTMYKMFEICIVENELLPARDMFYFFGYTLFVTK